MSQAKLRAPFPLPLAPMLAKSAPELPVSPGGMPTFLYEPKWDGFRTIVVRAGDEVELYSRGARPLTRYFPEVVANVLRTDRQHFVLDAELIVRTGQAGAQRLDWDALSARIHPANSRVAHLSQVTAAELVGFDLLASGGTSWLDAPLSQRKDHLAQWGERLPTGIHLTVGTTDAQLARNWFSQWEGAGIDGVVAKQLSAPYCPGKRNWIKLKHSRTAEVVVVGYRGHRSGQGVGSLLVGLYDQTGALRNVGGIGALSAQQRRDLEVELAPLVVRTRDGQVANASTERSRFSSPNQTDYVPLRPELVVEVKFGQLQGHRFRHPVQLLRWRPDRDPESCLLSQVDRPVAYDLSELLPS